MVIFLIFLGILFFGFIYWLVIEPFFSALARDKLIYEFASGAPSPNLRGKRVAVLVNPSGGARRALSVVNDLVIPILTYHKAVVQTIETQPNCAGLAEAFSQEDFDLLVLCSGDGTLHQLVNAIGIPRIPMVIMPCGSSNGLASSLGASTMRGALRNLTSGTPKLCDAMKVSFTDEATKKVVSKYELQVLALGIIAEHDVLQEETLRPYMGPLLRGMVAPIIVIMRANWFRFRLSFVSSAGVQSEFEGKGVASALPPMKDDRHVLEFEASAVLIGGSSYGDSSGRVFPCEKLDDGAFSTLLFLRDSPLGLLKTFLAIHSNGTHLLRPSLKRWPCTDWSIEFLDHDRFVITLSGERYRASKGPVVCSVLPKALKLVYCELRE